MKSRFDLSSSKRALLEQRRDVGTAVIPRRPHGGAAPLSFGQQRLYFLDQLTPGNPAYNLPFATRLTGPFDAAAMEQALHEVVARHTVLRTTFVERNGELEQVIGDTATIALPVVDLGSGDPAQAEAEARRYAAEEARRSFDLSRDPLLRATLLRLSERDHVLLLTVHHIAADGWSIGVLTRELSAAYTAFASGRSPALPALPIQYADFAVWQREWLQKDVLALQLAYWRARLAGTTALPFPTDRARPAVQTSNGGLVARTLPAVLGEAAAALARREGATTFMILLAAFQALLARYSGQDDVVVGSPIANRSRSEVEGLVGFFVNTLALRADVSGNPTFRQLLKQVRETTLGAYEHQDLPLEKLVEELGVERDLGRNPIFQVVFTLQNAPTHQPTLSGLSWRPFEADVVTTRFDVELRAHESTAGVSLVAVYNTDLFDAARIEALLAHYERFLEQVVRDPERRVGDVGLLGPDEERCVLEGFQPAPFDFPAESTVAERFDAQAARTPEAVAVVFDDATLTYRELEDASNRLAQHLRRFGVGPETYVGLCVPRSSRLVVAMLAIVKAGGAYVPLDPSQPKERLAFMLRDTDVRVVITDRASRTELPEVACPVLLLDADASAIAAESPEAPSVGGLADNAAYVIYTSGSTGVPKGVVVTHRAIARLVFTGNYVSIDASDRIAQASNAAFDAATFEIWGALLRGARLVGVSRDVALSPTDFARHLQEHGVTKLFVTTALFNLLAREAPAVFAGLRDVLFGGEAVDPTWVRSVLAHHAPGRLLHVYGPTETTTYATWHLVESVPEGATTVPIGAGLSNTQLYVLDARRHLVPIGVPGELYIGGPGLARGYLNRPDLTADRFVPNPFGNEPGARLYRTGDLVRWRADGAVEFLGRVDHQVKLRGFRIELGEIEAVLLRHEAVRECIVVLREDVPGDKRLVAYVATDASVSMGELRSYLQAQLPEYMVPAAFVRLDALPLNANGKVDRPALPKPERGSSTSAALPRNDVERRIAAIWQDVLQHDGVGVHDNFFDLGGHSLLLTRVFSRLREAFPDRALSVVDLFRHPTVHALAGFLSPAEAPAVRMAPERHRPVRSGAVAIVGLSGRFPGARDVDSFWRNLREGRSGITRFDDAELRAAGLDARTLDDPRYVKVRGALDDFDRFDAAFFGISPREAEVLDPQQRLFLECAWEALEHAGYDPERYRGAIGVYAGVSLSTYLLQWNNDPDVLAAVGRLGAMIGNDKDFLPTRVSYKLNLRGPSVSVQTACSTSLVAVHLARRSLLDGECDMALAGGVSIGVPHRVGYWYEEESIRSPDGTCRAFDARAQGIVPGSGVGIVALKRLEDALADRDTIHAVILGSAINNDGAAKVGYTAPGVDGQAAVIAAAQAAAGVAADSIGYVEAHGTATSLGDPIEVAALKQVFDGVAPGSCALGALKTNVGHLDAAAGVAGLIKAALCVKHAEHVPTLHFESPNPKLAIESSPFYVSTRLAKWESEGPRRAGVSSFGIGGTNAHVVIEEPPSAPEPGPERAHRLLVLSAKTEAAREQAASNLMSYLRDHPDANLDDVSYTLQQGRRSFAHRRAVVCRDVADGRSLLGGSDPSRVIDGSVDGSARSVVFLFPGQGAQHAGMARGLYEAEPAFRAELDRCADLLKAESWGDLREQLFAAGDEKEHDRRLRETSITQPALFAVSYSLASLWISWGVRPDAMIGHSLGEYVAAVLSGVLSLEDGLRLVVERGRLMQEIGAGSMLAVPLPARELSALLDGELSLAASNAPSLSVASGPEAAIQELERRLAARGTETRRLHTSHAFHSAMMEPILERFARRVSQVALNPPQIPYVSNVTGQLIRAEEATDPSYWARHLRATVRFGEGIAELLKTPNRVCLEVGPGQTLSALVRRHASVPARAVVASARHPKQRRPDEEVLLEAVGRLWCEGIDVDWERLQPPGTRSRVPLPTYPFERQRYWIEPRGTAAAPPSASLGKTPDVSRWFYLPSWTRTARPARVGEGSRRWLVFHDEDGIGDALAAQLLADGHDVASVQIGRGFSRGDRVYTVDPKRRDDHRALFEALRERDWTPQRIAHLWGVRAAGDIESELATGFYSALAVAQEMGDALSREAVTVGVVTSEAHDVTGAEELRPAAAAAAGVCKVAPQEYFPAVFRSIDVLRPKNAAGASDLAAAVRAEIESDAVERTVAYRNGHRWAQTFRPLPLKPPAGAPSRLREHGVYLITGGLGGVGLELAEALSHACRARLVLVGRSAFPQRGDWAHWLESHDDDDVTSRRIRRLRAIEMRGSEVLIVQADVTREDDVREVLARTLSELGAVDGVVHAAGNVKAGLPVSDADEAHCEAEFAAKMRGLLVLDRVLAGRRLDFCLVHSSLASVLGVVGFVSYVASHLFMDAFAWQQRRRGGVPWTSVNWDNWQTWKADAHRLPVTLTEFMMTPEEGADAFRRVLDVADDLPQIAVSTGSLDRRIECWITLPAASSNATAAAAGRAPHTRPPLRSEYVAPRSPGEAVLVRIWQDLLAIQPIGVNDNFFELGGDSVVSIQMIARAHEAGLAFSARQIFERQTIAELATVAGSRATPEIDQGPVGGAVGLTPVQRWFFEQALSEAHHFNQTTLLELRQPVSPDLLEEAWEALVRHHDALRLRFRRGDEGWVAHSPHAEEEVALRRVALADRAPGEQALAIERTAEELQRSLDLTQGPLLRVAHFDLGPDRPARLLVIIHHLVVDAISWRILLEDLVTACRQLARGEAVHLPAKTTSLKRWSRDLTALARSEALGAEVAYWLSLPWDKVAPLAVDRSGPNTVGSASSVTLVLEPDETRGLLQEVPERCHVHINDALLLSLGRAFESRSGGNVLLVDLEGHGREAIVGDADVSRTVGWFTTLFPVLLELPAGDDDAEALQSVHRQLQAVPHHGIGYGLLRYLRGDATLTARLEALPAPAVSFLYLGRTNRVPESGVLAPALESAGSSRSAQSARRHALEVSAGLFEGRLHTTWVYSENVHERSTVVELAEAFAEALRSLVRLAREEPARAIVPEDFPGARLSQGELDAFLAAVSGSLGVRTR